MADHDLSPGAGPSESPGEAPQRRRQPRATARAAVRRPRMASEAVGPNGVPFGRRVAQLRKNLGLSQIQLGDLMDRSEAWVSQVERGTRHIDRMSVLEKLAGVLMVSVADLTPGLPLRSGDHGVAVAPKAGPLSIAVAERGIAARAGEITRLEEDVDDVLAKVAAGQYTHESEAVISLLPRLEASVRHKDQEVRDRAYAAMAVTYQVVADLLAEAGDPAAAWVSADRAIQAADQAGRPLVAIQGAAGLAAMLHRSGRPDLAERVALIARETVSAHNTAGSRQLFGALTLRLADLAARASNAEAAYEYLREAERIAQRQRVNAPDRFGVGFNYAAVRLREVIIAVELGDAGRALRVADSFATERLSPDDQATLRLSCARAHAQRKDMREAARAVLAAVDLSPEVVASSREMVPLVAELRSMGLLPPRPPLDRLVGPPRED